MLLIPFFSTRCLQMFVICCSVRCFLYRGVSLVCMKCVLQCLHWYLWCQVVWCLPCFVMCLFFSFWWWVHLGF